MKLYGMPIIGSMKNYHTERAFIELSNSCMDESIVNRAVQTKLPPCCLRIFQGKFILVGTYDLDKPSGKRTGSLDVFDKYLRLIKSYDTYGAILDLKLSSFDENLVATAHSTGNVTLWRIVTTTHDDSIELHQLANLQVFETDALITSLHFSPLDPRTLLVTNTLGHCAIADIVDETITLNCSSVATNYEKMKLDSVEVQGSFQNVIKIEPAEFIEGHSLECWTGEFGQLQPLENVVFTGGDDAKIIAHDLRTKDIIWSNERIHEAGVVAIKSGSATFRHSRPTSIITGSYDDKIRSLDLRMLGESIYPGRNSPMTKSWDCGLGGGVWRFSEFPRGLSQDISDSNSTLDQLLVCCMYNGAKIIEIREDREDIFRVKNYLKTGHESMCYGGDWCKDFVATCSFYDKSLQMWHV